MYLIKLFSLQYIYLHKKNQQVIGTIRKVKIYITETSELFFFVMLSKAKHLFFTLFETLRYAQGDIWVNFSEVSNSKFSIVL